MQDPKNKNNESYREYLFIFLKYISRHKVSYGVGLICIAVTNWMMVTIPEYIRVSIDLISSEGLSFATEQLTTNLTIMLALSLSVIVVRTFSRILFFNPGRAIEYEIKNDLFKKLMALPKSYYDKNPMGNIISRVNNDISGVRLTCGYGIMQICNLTFALSLTPLKMFQLSMPLTLYCVLPVIVCFTLARMSLRAMKLYSRERMSVLQGLSGYTSAMLSGVDTIKNFSIFGWSEKKFKTYNQGLLQRSLKVAWIRSFMMPILTNLPYIMQVVILSVGGSYVFQGKLSIGDLSAFTAYAFLITMPLVSLGWLSTMIQQGFIGLASINSILSYPIPPIILDASKTTQKTDIFGSGLEIKNLYFQYPDAKKSTLQGLSFSIASGQTIGILGTIGSGKTTLVNCVNRYLPVSSGMMFMNGKDMSEIPADKWRHSIRTVTQDIFLFSDSLENNIEFGNAGTERLGQERWDEIIFHSALSEELKRLPNGKDTLVGEKGVMLSGGQKQRLSLARAMVTPCDLLILDNILSAVDYETERFLLRHILEKKNNRSLLLISHRTQALKDADKILVLDNGRIIEEGRHVELMKKNGYYAKTWGLQHDESNN